MDYSFNAIFLLSYISNTHYFSAPLNQEDHYNSNSSNAASDLDAQDDDFLQPPTTDRRTHHTSRDRRKKRQMRSGGGTTMGARPRRHQLLAPITANARTHPTITAKQNQHHTSRDRRKKRQMRSGGGTTMGARPRRHQLLAPITANARTHPTITAKQNQMDGEICHMNIIPNKYHSRLGYLISVSSVSATSGEIVILDITWDATKRTEKQLAKKGAAI
ncbi:hypothetical protein Tcan_05831 [Toxocara canis]|uniref:Uncharacterized protein n=1 Tax=Toxocara canis TaxID=6265 RepID=A0A0B2VR28_TOXCA|nr:hypothetical protein Tcan_05831 [Toxocara canis]